MSRSYRKHAIATDGQDSAGRRKKERRLANKRVRRQGNVSDGNNYKRVSNSWNICDWKFDDKSPRGRRK